MPKFKLKPWARYLIYFPFLTIIWSGVSFASSAPEKHQISGSLGLGLAATSHEGGWIGSSKTAGNFRLLFDLKMERRYLWGIDLDWFRINRRGDAAIPYRYDGEGLGLVIAYRLNSISFWGRWGGGRLSVRQGEELQANVSRHAYFKSSAGVNWAFYQGSYVWVELASSLGWLQAARSLRPEQGPSSLALLDLQIALTLFDL